MTRPLAIDLFCGLGGWSEGLLAEGWRVVGFDIERHQYGAHRYPAQLIVQDVLTLHGSQFKDAALIVASPPCQAYSWMAMPWKLAKAKAAAIRADESGQMLADLNRLFDACFRIQAQASMAAKRHIPMVVENVRGAQPWVGRARWNYGSFYLWGDVPALMPDISNRTILKPQRQQRRHGSGSWFAIDIASARRGITDPAEVGVKLAGSGANVPGIGWTGFAKVEGGVSWRNREGVKHHGSGATWFDKALDERRKEATAMRNAGIKQSGIRLSNVGFNVSNAREFQHLVEGAKAERSAEDKRQHIGTSRKFASAMIAKIPPDLSRHVAAVFRP